EIGAAHNGRSPKALITDQSQYGRIGEQPCFPFFSMTLSAGVAEHLLSMSGIVCGLARGVWRKNRAVQVHGLGPLLFDAVHQSVNLFGIERPALSQGEGRHGRPGSSI